MTTLERREIEIELVSQFEKVLLPMIGKEQVESVVRKVVMLAAKESAGRFRERSGEPDLGDFHRVWQELGSGGSLEIGPVETSEDGVSFPVTKCAYAEMYRKKGLERLGYLFSCGRDACFAEALVPGTVMERSETILLGDQRCGFRFRRRKHETR